MQIIKRSDGVRYREKVYINGRQVVSPVFTRKCDAKTWKREQLIERDKLKAMGINYIPVIKFKEFSDIFLQNKQSMAQRTYEGYYSIIKIYLLPEFSNRTLNSIKLQDAENLKHRLLQENRLSRTRINNILNCFKIIMNEAVKTNHLIRSPFINLKFVPTQERKLNYWLPNEAQAFLKANIDDFYYSLYLVLLNLGLRKGEAFGLQWESINFNEGYLTIDRAMTRSGLKRYTKNNKTRYIPLNDLVLSELHKVKERGLSLNFVFTKPNGAKIDFHHFTNRIFTQAIDRAGVKKIRLHDLRTTFASNFVMNGGDIFALSKWLGHSSVVITEKKYAHLHASYMATQKDMVKLSATPTIHLKII